MLARKKDHDAFDWMLFIIARAVLRAARVFPILNHANAPGAAAPNQLQAIAPRTQMDPGLLVS